MELVKATEVAAASALLVEMEGRETYPSIYHSATSTSLVLRERSSWYCLHVWGTNFQLSSEQHSHAYLMPTSLILVLIPMNM